MESNGGNKNHTRMSNGARLNLHVLEAAIEQAGEAIVVTDVQGTIQYVNPAFERITGYSRTEVLGKNPRILKSGVHSLEFYKGLWDTITSGKIWTGYFVNRKKDGSLYYEQATIAPIKDEANQITGFVAIKEDVTAFEESRRRFTTLLSNLPGMVYRCRNDKEWTMEFVSESVFELTGYTPAEIINNARVSYSSLILEEDRQMVWETVQRAVWARSAFQCIYRIRTADGQIKWVFEHGCGVFAPTGELVALEGYIMDITDYKRAQSAFEEEAIRRRLLMEGSRDGIVILDGDGKVVEANRRFAEMLGYTLEEVLSLYVWDFDAVWSKEELANRARTVGPEGESFVTRHRRKDGTLIDVEVNTNAVWIGDRKYILCICRDITEKKRVLEELERLASEWQITFDATKDAIILMDVKRRILRYNKAAELLCKSSANGITGRHCWEVVHGCAEPVRGCPFERAREAKLRQSAELLVGDSWYEIIVDPVLDGRGEFVGAVEIISDISERKRLEAQLLRAQRLEALGALAAGIAHDLNNVLTPILMAAPLLKDAISNPELLGLVETIQSCAERGAGVVKQLLTFARGRPNVLAPINVTYLVKDIYMLLKETFPRNIQTEVVCSNDVWPIKADASQVHQAILNLCVNARDAMPNGGKLRIEVANEQIDEMFAASVGRAKAGNYVRIGVIDTGVGIPPENLEKIFDPFFTTKEPGKGTGLGLAIVQKVVHGHGGFVLVRSKMGEGTQFDLYFPASPSEVPTLVHYTRSLPPRGRGELVLVVDDEVEILDVIRRVLENHGYSVIVANTGAEAVMQFINHKDEITGAIVDLMMTDIEGKALISSFRKVNPQVPVIAITGLLDSGSVSQEHAAAILVKPFSATELLITLHRSFIEWIRTPRPSRE